ncbi:hypothetical protein LQK93_02590 [Terrabacter sp. BE26]
MPSAVVPPARFELATPALGAEYALFSRLLGWVTACLLACRWWGLAGDRLGRCVPRMGHAGLRSDPNSVGWVVPRRRRLRRSTGRVVDTITRPGWAVVLSGSRPRTYRLGTPSSPAHEPPQRVEDAFLWGVGGGGEPAVTLGVPRWARGELLQRRRANDGQRVGDTRCNVSRATRESHENSRVADLVTLVSSLGAAIVGGVVSPMFSQRRERVAARADVRRGLTEVESRRHMPGDYQAFHKALASFEASAILAGMPWRAVKSYSEAINAYRDAVEVHYDVGPNGEDGYGVSDPRRHEEHDRALERLSWALWHPWLSRFRR